jgi:hypothetical protein
VSRAQRSQLQYQLPALSSGTPLKVAIPCSNRHLPDDPDEAVYAPLRAVTVIAQARSSPWHG